MYPDFKELLFTFNAHGVEYLIVGGYAVNFYSQPRATKDLDLLIRADDQNAQRVFAALAEFGAPLDGLTRADFSDSSGFFRMGHPPIMIEILMAIQGVEFALAWTRRVEVVIDPQTALTAPVISREDLIAAKLAAARSQDLADVDAIRQALASQDPAP